MLSLEEAQSRILSLVKSTGSEEVPLHLADGRFAAETVRAQVDLPGFDNSAMDGYAVRCADLESARVDAPVSLRVMGKIAAGDATGNLKLDVGTCARVFTGSILPGCSDAVIMQEDTREGANGSVECLDLVRPFENVRLAGEDVKKGVPLITSGQRLNAGKISLCAAAGIESFLCGRRPVVGLIATGNELVEPGQPLGVGQIYESNHATLAALAHSCGAEVKLYPIVHDSLDLTRAALRTAFDECDFVTTSGGVSVGELDFVKPAFEACGGTLDFWRVAIKPGKPLVLGRIGNKLLFGLPGNPVSAFVTFLLLVRPALLGAQGATQTGLRSLFTRAAERFVNQGERRHFLRVQFTAEGEVKSAGTQASHILSSLAKAEGLLDLRPNSSIEAGALVPVLVWE